MGQSEADSQPDISEDTASIGVDTSGIVGAGESDRSQLLAGKITREEFLERVVDRAVAHLDGAVDSSKLEQIRELLYQQLEEDPALGELVTRATGD